MEDVKNGMAISRTANEEISWSVQVLTLIFFHEGKIE